MKLVTTQPYFWVGFWGVVTTTGFYLCSFQFFNIFLGGGMMYICIDR